MRPLRTFKIEPLLPENLSGLIDLALNLRWAWRGEIREVFRRLDAKVWDATGHNPVAMLGQIDQERLEAVGGDAGFLSQFRRVHADLQDYLARSSWWSENYGPAEGPQIAYFCAEFGLTDAVPIYSGGLGVLGPSMAGTGKGVASVRIGSLVSPASAPAANRRRLSSLTVVFA